MRSKYQIYTKLNFKTDQKIPKNIKLTMDTPSLLLSYTALQSLSGFLIKSTTNA